MKRTTLLLYALCVLATTRMMAITSNITVTALPNTSAIYAAIGEENLPEVTSLTVKGTINSYDLIIIRNKMLKLESLDLTNASIVACSYPYYKEYTTANNELGPYAFSESLSQPKTVKLPNTITSIGDYAFQNCGNLTSVTIGNSVKTIGYEAFYDCDGLTSVNIPNSVKTIGGYAFYDCDGLTSVTIGNSVETIGSWAFYSCGSLTSVTIGNSVETIGSEAFRDCDGLTSVTIPNSVKTIGSRTFYSCGNLTSVTIGNSVETIGSQAFYSCGNLTSVRLPSSIRSIEGSAFSNCSKLLDYYTYTVEPTSITESTFSNWTTATLHIPTLAYYNYYWDTQWSKFARLVEDTEYKYDYFYLTQDMTLSSGAGLDTPTIDLNASSGLVVDAQGQTVKLDEVHIANQASIIANGNLQVEKLYFDLTVTKNKWHFLTFPFRVKLTNVTAPGNFVFRYYDGATRAQSGKGGWKNVETAYLNAGQGYIFQTDTDGTLTLLVEKADMDFSGTAKQNVLNTYAATATANASWNFMGNPHTSYYDINKTGYTAPITVWNGSAYQAVRPGDDQYYMQPFQAFFAQKPEGVSAMSFPADGRCTYNQMKEAQAAAARSEAPATVGPVPVRSLVNLTIATDDGTQSDQTRVVFNDGKSAAYELDCDAAKFFSESQPAQLYTIGTDGTQYAINERPEGEVALGYTAATEGLLTISAQRMDRAVTLYDSVMGICHDLAQGDYTFHTEGGTFESRFTLGLGGTITGIDEMASETAKKQETVYDLQGRRADGSRNGCYIVKGSNGTTKKVIRK